MSNKELLEKGICPRCGQPFNYFERREQGGNVYILCVHVTKEGGKRHYRKCYLGPESQYLYVTQMHREENLVFRGLMSYDRAIEYLKRIAEYLRGQDLSDEERKLLARTAKELIEISGAEEREVEEIKVSREEREAIRLYFETRKTKGMSKESRESAVKLFRKVFSPGKRLLEVEG
jgi:hypothetical protein